MVLKEAFFEYGAIEGGALWVYDNLLQCVCRIDMDSWELEIASCYEGEAGWTHRIFLVGGRLYIVLSWPPRILIYDRQGGASAFRLVEPMESDGIEGAYEAFESDGYLYFIPSRLGGKALRFDPLSERFSQRETLPSFQKEALYAGRITQHQGSVWFPILGTDLYARYALADGTAEVFRAGGGRKLGLVCSDGEDVWFTEAGKGEIVCEGRWAVSVQGEQSYSAIYNLGEYIVACPRFSAQLVFVEKSTFKASILPLPLESSERRQRKGSGIIRCLECPDCIYFFPHGIRALFRVHKETMEAERIRLTCRDYAGTYRKILSFRPGAVMWENGNIGIGQFVQAVKGGTGSGCMRANVESIGKSVWGRALAHTSGECCGGIGLPDSVSTDGTSAGMERRRR